MLLYQALLDLGCQVVRVVLGVGGEHAVHEAAGWRLVDVLRCRHEPDAHLEQLLVEHRVVESVACEPVELVDDDVGDAELRHLLKHLLQDWALSAAGALGSLNVRPLNHSAEVMRLALARLHLGRKRVAVRVAVAAELPAAGDACVDRSLSFGSRGVRWL